MTETRAPTPAAREPEPGRPRGFRAAIELALNTAKDARDDRIIGVAGEVAFFALLAIPPLLLVVAALTGAIAGVVGADAQMTIQENVISGLGGFLSSDATDDFVRPAVEGVFSGEARGGVLSLGLVLALWSSSRLIKVVIEALNIAYDVEDWRSAWKRRLLAVGLTFGGIVSISIYLPFLIAGPRLGRGIAEWVGLGGAFEVAWAVLYWPLAGILGIALLTSLYHVAPNWHTPWRRDLPGAILAAIVWLAAAFALRLYVAVSVTDSAFGPLAAPVVLMLWLYVSGLAVLLGAELNAEVEKLWPTPESHPKATRFASAAFGQARARARAVTSRLRRRRRDGHEPADDV